MLNEYVQVGFDKIVQTRVYTAVVLRHNEHRFAIFSEPSVGRFLQMHLSDEERQRPYTHDLMHRILESFNVRIKQVVVNDVQDNIFFARLFLEMEKDGLRHIVEIDARPSDCIIMAFLHNAPVFCANHVLEKATPFVE